MQLQHWQTKLTMALTLMWGAGLAEALGGGMEITLAMPDLLSFKLSLLLISLYSTLAKNLPAMQEICRRCRT